jgi:hypothetical protein
MGMYELRIFHLTNVSADWLGGLSWLNRTDSGLVGLYGLNHSDSAAHAKHYIASKKKRFII